MSLSIMKMREELSRAHAATKRAREKGGEVLESAIDAGLAGLTGWVLGQWEGRSTRSEQFEVFGVPAPLATAVAAHVGAVFGVGRNMEPRLRAIGNAGVALHMRYIGHGQGEQWRAKNPDKPGLMGDDLPALPVARRSAVGVSASELAAAAL